MARQLESSSPTEAVRKQTFRFTAPTAQSVLLVGDFTRWREEPIPLQKGKGGIWSTTVDLTPGPYNYKFIVDGEWTDDPECTLRVPNPFGTQNMIRRVV